MQVLHRVRQTESAAGMAEMRGFTDCDITFC